MQFSVVALAALVASVSAGYSNETVVYTTEVHTAYTTVCPASTELTFNGVTYTATAVSNPPKSALEKTKSSSLARERRVHVGSSDWNGLVSGPAQSESLLTSLPEHHLDHHQLPLHHCQANHHLIRSVLQHLVTLEPFPNTVCTASANCSP